MTALTADSKIAGALAALSLEEKVQLLTGRDFWTTWPIEKIGLRRILVSDGPSGVRGETWDERDPSLNLPSATALASSWIRTSPGATAPRPRWRPAARASTWCSARRSTCTARRSADGISRRSARIRCSPPTSPPPTCTACRTTVGATPKHYVANDSETDRFTVDVRVGDRALRELYLLAFEKAVTQAHAWLVMSSYNSVNALPRPRTTCWRPAEQRVGLRRRRDQRLDRRPVAGKRPGLAGPGHARPDGPWGEALVRAVRSGEISEAAVDRKVAASSPSPAVGALDGFPPRASLVEDGIASSGTPPSRAPCCLRTAASCRGTLPACAASL